jgi:hypothetical protein
MNLDGPARDLSCDELKQLGLSSAQSAESSASDAPSADFGELYA